MALSSSRWPAVCLFSWPLLTASSTSPDVSTGGIFIGGSEPTGPPLSGTFPFGRSMGSGHVLYSWSHRLVQRPLPGGSPVGSSHFAGLMGARLPVQSPAETKVPFPVAGAGAAA